MKKYTVFCINCMRTIVQMFEGTLCDKAAEDHIAKHPDHRVIVGHLFERHFPMK